MTFKTLSIIISCAESDGTVWYLKGWLHGGDIITHPQASLAYKFSSLDDPYLRAMLNALFADGYAVTLEQVEVEPS